MAVYELLMVDREVPPVQRRDKSLKIKLAALIKAFELLIGLLLRRASDLCGRK